MPRQRTFRRTLSQTPRNIPATCLRYTSTLPYQKQYGLCLLKYEYALIGFKVTMLIQIYTTPKGVFIENDWGALWGTWSNNTWYSGIIVVTFAIDHIRI